MRTFEERGHFARFEGLPGKAYDKAIAKNPDSQAALDKASGDYQFWVANEEDDKILESAWG